MLYEFTDTEIESFNPDPELNTEAHTALTASDVEERMNATLHAWGWTEDTRGETPEEFDYDVEAAYRVAVNSPSGTPLDLFEQIMTARGWPRTGISE